MDFLGAESILVATRAGGRERATLRIRDEKGVSDFDLRLRQVEDADGSAAEPRS